MHVKQLWLDYKIFFVQKRRASVNRKAVVFLHDKAWPHTEMITDENILELVLLCSTPTCHIHLTFHTSIIPFFDHCKAFWWGKKFLYENLIQEFVEKCSHHNLRNFNQKLSKNWLTNDNNSMQIMEYYVIVI